MSRRPRPVLLGLTAAAIAACRGGGVELISPPAPPAAGLRVVVVPDQEDAAQAQALGWTAGIPGADVVVRPADSSRDAVVVATDEGGVADFGDVPAGDYLVESHRWLTPAERAALPAGSDVDGWVVGATVSVSASGGQRTVAAVASRRRALVISEWAFNVRFDAALGTYLYGGYLELYNNADTTVYLDGVVIAEGFVHPIDVPGGPCSQFESWTNDPLGIWSSYFQQLPGAGLDHPLTPGGTAMIATDAIDHRPIFPGALDLRAAKFEFSGEPDADNPAVLNAIDVGPDSHAGGHGLFYPGLAMVAAVTSPVDPASLATAVLPSGHPANRLPADRVLDVLAIGVNYDPVLSLECPHLVHASFDRAASRARGHVEFEEYDYSLVRRATGLASEGRPILQHTRTGALDFVRSLRTPGRYP